MIYETKGLTLEEVDELYEMVNKAWRSKEFRPAVKFAVVQKELGETPGEGRHMSLADVAAAQERRRSSVAPGAAADGKEMNGDYGEKRV